MASIKVNTAGELQMVERVTPRIYVACLASYNAGILHGRWIDCGHPDGVDHIESEVKAMLKESTQHDAEEWAIHDHENMGGISESESFERCADIGYAVSDLRHLDSEALLHWLEYNPDGDIDDFEDAFYSVFTDKESFAQEVMCDRLDEAEKEWPQLSFYIDWEAVARDLLINDFYSVDGRNGVFIFRHL